MDREALQPSPKGHKELDTNTHQHYPFYSTLLPEIQRHLKLIFGLPWWLNGKESTRQCRRCEFDPWVGKRPWKRKWQSTPVFLSGKPMDGGAQGATVHGSQRVRHDSVTNKAYFFFFFLFVVDFVIHWNETAKGLHVFPIPIPPPTSLSTQSL